MNNFTDIKGGKFTSQNLEQVHPACGVLADFVINWWEASNYKRKLLDIEEARTAKQDEIDRLNQIKLDAIAAEEAERKAREKAAKLEKKMKEEEEARLKEELKNKGRDDDGPKNDDM